MPHENPIIPKVWITKYALTRGVYTAENVEIDGSMIRFKQAGFLSTVYVHKPDWHETEAEAMAQVKVMLDAAQRALEKKLAKLESQKRAWAAGSFKTQPWKQS
jgi:hypothetical protein